MLHRGGAHTPCYAHLERKRGSLEMRSVALGEESLGACFHGESDST
jgi:hypothetical protein